MHGEITHWKRRHTYSFDLRAISDKAHRQIIQDALNVCDYPFGRIRRRFGVRVPVGVKTLSYNQASVDAHEVHVVEDPENRQQALGLYWLPTSSFPVGRIEVAVEIMNNPDLAREVFLAEAAHAVDYGAMTDVHRTGIATIVHGGDPAEHGTHGWWEERGGNNYWADWVGETFMSLFMRSFAPSLPRPLEARQPWAHRVNDSMVGDTRKVLLAR